MLEGESLNTCVVRALRKGIRQGVLRRPAAEKLATRLEQRDRQKHRRGRDDQYRRRSTILIPRRQIKSPTWAKKNSSSGRPPPPIR